MSASWPADRVPHFAEGIRIRWDETRQRWILLAPEKVVVAEPPADDVLRSIDGVRSVGDIVTELAEMFEAAPEQIADDVIRLLNELAAEGLVQ